MSHIFISHAERDGQAARDLGTELEKAGFKVWFYERDSLPGATYISQVAKALRECRAVVVIVSPESLKSDQVTNEIVRAYEGHKPFMPVLYGITHEEFREARDDWRQCLGASTSISVPEQGVAAIVPRIAQGLEHLGIEPGEAPKPPEPKPTPVRAAEPTRPESKPEPAKPEQKHEPVAKPASAAPKPERRPPTPRRKLSPWLWAGIAAVVVVVVLGVWLLPKSAGNSRPPSILPSATPEEVIYEYFKAFNDGKPRRAYDLFSNEYRAQFGFDQWAAKVLDPDETYHVVSCSTVTGDAERSGYKLLRVVHDIAKGNSSTREPILVEMKDEGQGWRIKSIRESP